MLDARLGHQFKRSIGFGERRSTRSELICHPGATPAYEDFGSRHRSVRACFRDFAVDHATPWECDVERVFDGSLRPVELVDGSQVSLALVAASRER